MSNDAEAPVPPSDYGNAPKLCQSIEWYAEGQSREVEVGGIRVTIRFVGRRGRRSRISIVAPSGAVFRDAQ